MYIDLQPSHTTITLDENPRACCALRTGLIRMIYTRSDRPTPDRWGSRWGRTWKGVLAPANEVNPTISEKKIVTSANDSGSTCVPFFNSSATDLKNDVIQNQYYGIIWLCLCRYRRISRIRVIYIMIRIFFGFFFIRVMIVTDTMVGVFLSKVWTWYRRYPSISPHHGHPFIHRWSGGVSTHSSMVMWPVGFTHSLPWRLYLGSILHRSSSVFRCSASSCWVLSATNSSRWLACCSSMHTIWSTSVPCL